jgi:hypothetical protein
LNGEFLEVLIILWACLIKVARYPVNIIFEVAQIFFAASRIACAVLRRVLEKLMLSLHALSALKNVLSSKFAQLDPTL